MIRYVVAVLLAVAILGITVSAVDHAAGLKSEQEVETEVTELRDAATELHQEEELPPRGQPGPRRTVTVSLPGDSATNAPVERFVVRPETENVTLVTYRVRSRATQRITFDVPTRVAGSASQVELDGSGDVELLLTLERDADGDRIVEIGRR